MAKYHESLERREINETWRSGLEEQVELEVRHEDGMV